VSVSAGRYLGSYEILAALGAGGMGEVYRARDIKLNRPWFEELKRLVLVN
jgi:hypothetical protein